VWSTLLTPATKLKGILPVVISGGRPRLKERCVARFLPSLQGVTDDPVWAVTDKDAPEYEPDGHEIVPYARDWAEEYAARNWTATRPMVPGGFLGAFPGREFACRLAEERGCWAVMQLDDNINRLQCFTSYAAAVRVVRNHGSLGMFADVLAAVTLSTNGRMVGGYLDSVNPEPSQLKVSRVGFPYSLFIEVTGDGREPWVGPFEDDITHAYQYGDNASSDTTLLVPALRYKKESSSRTGMRARYTGERAVPLQRMFPESAKIGIRKAHSNGRGGSRVFHTMGRGALRTPMVITDRELYGRVGDFLRMLGRETVEERHGDLMEKAQQKAARWDAT
jgi:hypothetical protein